MSPSKSISPFTWSEITREERVYCAELWFSLRDDPRRLVRWLADRKDGLKSLDSEADWELGYEVCFYRDMLHRFAPEDKVVNGLPLKRTFDLCLMSTEAIVIIEAKVFESFSTKQNEDVAKDPGRIRRLFLHLGMPAPRAVCLVSLSVRAPQRRNPFELKICWTELLELKQFLTPRMISMIGRLY